MDSHVLYHRQSCWMSYCVSRASILMGYYPFKLMMQYVYGCAHTVHWLSHHSSTAPQELVGRIQGRLIHPGSGRSYHVKTHPPKVPGKDDITGEDLVQRVDDTCEVLQRRLQQYHSTTAPLLQYYEEKNLLHVIDASKSVDKVSDQVLRSIKSI
uniref:Adenylate kinase 2, mitochondrial n=1 Tax=Lygus hesperus TaxID=30085 RepID=A0A0A9YIK0_LYGHE